MAQQVISTPEAERSVAPATAPEAPVSEPLKGGAEKPRVEAKAKTSSAAQLAAQHENDVKTLKAGAQRREAEIQRTNATAVADLKAMIVDLEDQIDNGSDLDRLAERRAKRLVEASTEMERSELYQERMELRREKLQQQYSGLPEAELEGAETLDQMDHMALRWAYDNRSSANGAPVEPPEEEIPPSQEGHASPGTSPGPGAIKPDSAKGKMRSGFDKIHK